MFRAFRRPTAVFTRIFPSRRATHIGVDCGEPSGLTVATCQKFLPSNSLPTSSGSCAMSSPLVAGEEFNRNRSGLCRLGGDEAPRRRRRRAQPPRGLRGRERAVVVEALAEVAAELLQPLRLLARFDALGDDLEAQGLGEADDRTWHPLVGRSGADPLDQRTSDLEDVERSAAERIERRWQDAGLVQGDAEVELKELR